jgi:hypothetical protein
VRDCRSEIHEPVERNTDSNESTIFDLSILGLEVENVMALRLRISLVIMTIAGLGDRLP